MKRHWLLLLDASINLLLGLILIIFSDTLVSILGMPASGNKFYPNILGAVLIGITIALVVEYFRHRDSAPGLGLSGAVAINLCGGVMLILWLIFGGLDIPQRGRVILWTLAVILVVVSTAELAAHRGNKP